MINETAGKQARPNISTLVAAADRELERLEKLATSLTLISDRLEGARPEPNGPSTLEEKPSCLLDAMETKQRRIAHFISRCEEASSRIDAAVG